jgi:hypothetical protein
VAPTDLLHGGEELLALHPDPPGEGEEQVLGREVLVVEVDAGGVGGVEGGLELATDPGLAPVGLGELGHGLVGRVADRDHRDAEALQDRQHDAPLLAHQREQEVVRRDLGVRCGLGGLDGPGDRLLGLVRPAVRVERHGGILPPAEES